jgi:prepilin-type N-terminal cleavage/methylation domain-containing protein
MAIAHLLSTMSTLLSTRVERRAQGERGFTLVEVMIVVAIIAIGAGLAVPNYLIWQTRSELRDTTSQVWQQLGWARMAAMNRNTTITVTVTASPSPPFKTISVTSRDAANTDVISPLIITTRHVAGVNAPLNGTATVQFNSLGLLGASGFAVATPQLVTLANDTGITYSLSVAPSGKATWCPKTTCP